MVCTDADSLEVCTGKTDLKDLSFFVLSIALNNKSDFNLKLINGSQYTAATAG